MVKLYIVRHGNTFDAGDTLLRVGGRTDLDLSISGKVQAERLGEHFKAHGVSPQQVLAGPLKRTLQTAAAITGALGLPPASVDERLREVDYGPDEGQVEEAVRARLGDAALDAWEREAIVPEGWLVDTAALKQSWSDILTDAARAEGDTMTVTSNGVARFVLGHVEGGGDQALKLKTGAYGVINLTGTVGRVEAWNVRP